LILDPLIFGSPQVLGLINGFGRTECAVKRGIKTKNPNIAV